MEDLQDLFARLCRIRSVTGEEREIADAVSAYLRSLGLEVHEDGAGPAARSETGNLRCVVEGRSEQTVLLCAHLDTVPHDGAVEPLLGQDGVWRSAGQTILGADNKAAVAVLLELARRAVERTPECGIELLFTVSEEDGLRGVKALDTGSLTSGFGFVLDHPTPIGEVVVAAPTYHRLTATFTGREAHAGVRPEDGASAIVAAARAVAGMRLGRLDEETTANVGTLMGGTAANVVARTCRLEAEARSTDEDRAGEVIGAMVEACAWGAGQEGCEVDAEVEAMFRSYRLRRSDPPVAAAVAALERCGHEPVLRSTGGGSDANVLNERGIPCANLANGTSANHTEDEAVAASALEEMARVVGEVVEEAAALC